MSAIDANDKATLRQFLVNRFSVSELKNLAFDLGVDYEILAGSSKQDLPRELIMYCERTGRMCLLIQAVSKLRNDAIVIALLQKVMPCKTLEKVQIIVYEKEINREDLAFLLDQISTRLNLRKDEISVVGAAISSFMLLLGGIPSEKTYRITGRYSFIRSRSGELIRAREFSRITAEARETWRRICTQFPPTITHTLKPSIEWKNALNLPSASDTLPFVNHSRYYVSDERYDIVRGLIDKSATLAASIGVAGAFTPQFDITSLASICTNLVISIGATFGIDLKSADAFKLVSGWIAQDSTETKTLNATGFLPRAKNPLLTSSIQAMYVDVIGWRAYAHFERTIDGENSDTLVE